MEYIKYHERYFDDDEDAAAEPELEYIPAPGSPSANDSKVSYQNITSKFSITFDSNRNGMIAVCLGF